MIRRLRHPGEPDLVLRFYGDPACPRWVDLHLAACASCAASYAALADTLASLPPLETPPRTEIYGLEVWQRIRPQLSDPRALGWSWPIRWRPVATAVVAALLLVAAFVAGRQSRVGTWPGAQVHVPAGARGIQTRANPDVLEPSRARIAATLDHLEQSERVLIELANARGSVIDRSLEQAWAADLVDANRLVRDAAAQAGDAGVATLLDDLERTLLDVVHRSSALTPAVSDDVSADGRARLAAAALLFKIRFLTDELRARETAPAAPEKTT